MPFLDSTGNPVNFIKGARGLVQQTAGWVDFDIDNVWMNFSSDDYFVVLRSPTSNVTWYGGAYAGVSWYERSSAGTWSSASLTNCTPALRVVDYMSDNRDNLTNLQEYLLGTNPKLKDTDAGTGGVISGLGDALSDGDEMVDKVIYRTNADIGALASTEYGPSTWILLDEDLSTADASDWLYYTYVQTDEQPAEGYAGAKATTSFYYTLPDGAEIRLNMSGGKLYIYLPGSNFEDLVEVVGLTEVTRHYNGTALVFVETNSSEVPSEYKSNAIVPDGENYWLFRYKQLYGSDPFDWDTDDDGIGDGWELGSCGPSCRYYDSDGDFVPNVRDFDSDNDGLTDGQEMLQVQSDWAGEHGTTAANLKFDPDGDNNYAMVDTDSDGDAIADANEVLWSVDTDVDNRINLVDWDADSDGLCDGWCTTASTTSWRTNISLAGWNVTLPPGMPNGEDVNQNGTNEQGESSPVKVDTDGDGLWDGYSYNVSASEWQLTQVDGRLCPVAGNTTKTCGEESTYSLYNSSFTSKTNRTNPDGDGDGLTDFFEVRGWPIRYELTGGSVSNNYTIANPGVKDTDSDGIPDATELLGGTNATHNDTDLDFLLDGTEDSNRDGGRQSNETFATNQDSDRDGLNDSTEDVDRDGLKDANEPSPLDNDTDDDGIWDKLEFDLMKYNDSSWAITHDFDGDGLTDLNDLDADNDGLSDRRENHYLDAVIGNNETNPYNPDTDNDTLWDGAEPSPFEDTDNDTYINGRDMNSNADGYNDNLQVWVAFRTNAPNGDYSGANTWVALIAPSANPYYPQQFDFAAGVALYTHVGVRDNISGGGQILNPYGPVPPGDERPPVELTTPENYRVMAMQNGSAYDVYIEINSERYEWFVRNSNAPGDYSTSNRTVRSFLVNHQEVYDGRVAIDMDPDFDDISTLAENPCGLNPNSNDTDGDGIEDGIEYNACANFDGDAKPDANDTDSDGDGIPDGIEDANKDGNRSATETFRLLVDSDGDGLADGTEDANRDGIKQANETSPIDRDTDDDGIGDGWAVFASSLSRVLTRDRLEHRHAGSGAPRAFTTAAAPG